MMCADGLAKLIEECGELIQVCGKKLAYFTTDVHPDGGRPLTERLQDEIADVQAACWLVSAKFGLNTGAIHDRAVRKLRVFMDWDSMTDNNGDAVDARRRAP